MIPGQKRLELYNKNTKQAIIMSNELQRLFFLFPADEWERKTNNEFIRNELKRQRLEKGGDK